MQTINVTMLMKYEAQKKLNTLWHILYSTFCDLRVQVFIKDIIRTPAHVSVLMFSPDMRKHGRCNYGCRSYPLHNYLEVTVTAASIIILFIHTEE